MTEVDQLRKDKDEMNRKSVWDLFSLKGKVAVVTGSTGGIGVEICQAYAEAGADLALWYASSTEAERLCDKIQKDHGIKARAYHVPITDSKKVNDTVQQVIKDFGRIDIFVINAGISAVAGILETSDELWHQILDTNLNGAMYCARAVGMVFQEQQAGSLITTSSISAHIVNRPQIATAYNTSKAGLMHLTKTLAVEFAAFGARANSISPGYVATSINDKLPQELLVTWNEMIPMRRQAEPWELKGAFLFLASAASTYVTGADVLLDGGYTSY